MILVTGASSAGKSAFAADVFQHIERVAYLSPLKDQLIDETLRKRINQQKSLRPESWKTVEISSSSLESDIRKLQSFHPEAYILDGIHLLFAAELTKKFEVYEESLLIQHCQSEVSFVLDCLAKTERPTIVVSSEVGAGVTPVHKSGRLFQDEIGSLNRQLAARAELVCQISHGIAMAIKYPESWVQSTPTVGRPCLLLSSQDARKVWSEAND